MNSTRHDELVEEIAGFLAECYALIPVSDIRHLDRQVAQEIITRTLKAVVDGELELPGEIHREMGGMAAGQPDGSVDIEFMHPHLRLGRVVIGFLPEYLPPSTRVGMILVALRKEKKNGD